MAWVCNETGGGKSFCERVICQRNQPVIGNELSSGRRAVPLLQLLVGQPLSGDQVDILCWRLVQCPTMYG